MAAPLEQYRAWERTGPFVHIMQIDRGDNSAGNRLTLTDRPYYDKGVAGVKYHHTYPAPIHCIISEIVTDEGMDGTSYADVIVTNATGRLDSLLDGYPVVQGHRFTMLRGHPEWSLVEQDYPFSFLEIFVGQVDSVTARKGTNELVLRIAPLRYRLDAAIGAPGQPISYGRVVNVPATLDDSAPNRWRFNTRVTTTTSTTTGDLVRIRDNGAPLTLTTDYTLIDEDGKWKGLIELVGAGPYRQLTADLNWVDRYYVYPDDITRQIIREHLVEDYALEGPSLDMSSRGTFGMFTFLNHAGTKLYYYDNDNGIFQYSLASDVDSSTYDSLSFDPGPGFRSGWLSVDGECLYLANSSTLQLYTLSTAGDISTASLTSTLTLSTLAGGSTVTRAIALSDDETTLWLMTYFNEVRQFAIPTPRTLSGLVETGRLSLKTLGGIIAPLGYRGSSDTANTSRSIMRHDDGGTFMFGLEHGQIVQVTLPTPDDISEIIDPRRDYVVPRGEFVRYQHFCLHPDGTRVYWLTSAEVLTQIDLPSPGNLPRRLLTAPFPVTNYYGDNALMQPAGVFYQNQVQVGAVLTDVLGAFGMEYSINRYGEIAASALVVPNGTTSWLFVYGADGWQSDIDAGDFIGDRRSHIEHVETIRAAKRVTINFRENYTEQSKATLAGTVSDTDADIYARRFGMTTVSESTLLGFVDPREIYHETKAYSESSVFNSQLSERMMRVFQRDRTLHRLRVRLSAIPVTSNFTVGHTVRAIGDWGHSSFTAEPYFRPALSAGSINSGLLSCAPTTLNRVTGNITVIARFQFLLTGTYPGGVLMCKARVTSSVLYGSWAFLVTPTGQLEVWASPSNTDTSAITKLTSTKTLTDCSVSPETWVWGKVDLQLSNGANSVAKFFYSQHPGNDRPPAYSWVPFETTTGPIISSINASAVERIIVGAYRGTTYNNAHTPINRVSRAILEDGIDGTPVADMDARRATDSASEFDSEVEGNIWTPSYWTNTFDMYAEGLANMAVVGERINWTKQQREITVFK